MWNADMQKQKANRINFSLFLALAENQIQLYESGM